MAITRINLESDATWQRGWEVADAAERATLLATYLSPLGPKRGDIIVQLDTAVIYIVVGANLAVPLDSGVVGPQGPTGSQGFPGIDGVDGEDGIDGINGVAGAQGIPGTNGINGIDGASGIDGLDGEQGEQGIPGNTGPAGINGSQGISGPIGPSGLDGEDGLDSLIPGPPGSSGPQGIQGIAGIPGPIGPPGLDAEEPLEPYIIPGPQGPQGPAGGGGGSATTIEVNLGATAKWSGSFTITDAGISGTSKILAWQAPGPYTGKGTRADEAQMAPVSIIAVSPGAGSAIAYWETPPMITKTMNTRSQYLQTGATNIVTNPKDPVSYSNGTARRLGKVRGNVKFSYVVFA